MKIKAEIEVDNENNAFCSPNCKYLEKVPSDYFCRFFRYYMSIDIESKRKKRHADCLKCFGSWGGL